MRAGDRILRLFRVLSADLASVRPTLINQVYCPLCLRALSLHALHELSIEHIVPSKLGGQSRTLTCTRCNNTQGTTLDSHLIRALTALDSLDGTEPIHTVIGSDQGKLVAEMLLPKRGQAEPITIKIVGKASNVAAGDRLRQQLADGFILNLQMTFSFIPERYWRAMLRAAYLAVFHAEGYAWVFSEGAATVRDVITGVAPVPQNMIMAAFPEQDPQTDLLVMPHAFTDAGECFTVLLRLRTKRTRYAAAMLPGKCDSNWGLLGNLYQHAPWLRLETTPGRWESPLVVNLGDDPVDEFRQGGDLLTRLRHTAKANDVSRTNHKKVS